MLLYSKNQRLGNKRFVSQLVHFVRYGQFPNSDSAIILLDFIQRGQSGSIEFGSLDLTELSEINGYTSKTLLRSNWVHNNGVLVQPTQYWTATGGLLGGSSGILGYALISGSEPTYYDQFSVAPKLFFVEIYSPSISVTDGKTLVITPKITIS